MSHNWPFSKTKLPNYSSWSLLLESCTLTNGLRDKRINPFRPNVIRRNESKPEVSERQLASPSPVESSHFQEWKDGQDLFLAIRRPLCFGALFGLIPIRGIFTKTSPKLQFSWFHWRTGITALITFLIGSNVYFISDPFFKLLSDSERQSAGELVFSFSGVWFYTAGAAGYFFFLFRSQELCQYFVLWNRISAQIAGTVKPDIRINRDMNWIAFVVLASSFGENVMYHFHRMTPAQRASLSEVSADELLREYYDANDYMKAFFDYHPAIAVTLLLVNKLTLYTWNFGDVALILLSRGIYGRFEGLNRHLESLLQPEIGGPGLMIQPGSVNWKSIRNNFLAIEELLKEGNRIFAPLIWLSFVTNIFFVSNQLYIQFSPSTPTALVSSIYVIWSFSHLIMRTLAVNLSAAKINESAHRIIHLLQHSYAEDYDKDVRRLEQHLGSREIGLTGNGCFVITRSFILMICSAIFTLEVVLLQNGNEPV